MFSLTLYTIVLIVHVAAAGVLLGSAVVAPLIRRYILSAPSLGVLRLWVEFGRTASRTHPPAALVLLATGVYLGSAGWWAQPWFFVAIAVWIVNSALAAMFVDGSTSQLSAAIGPREGSIDRTVDAIRRSRRWDMAFDVIRANDLAMLYVMFQKPGLAESVLVIAAAIAISCAAGVRRTRRFLQAPPTVVTNSPATV
jgi:hypothetical protein